jgi:hypothetical protein
LRELAEVQHVMTELMGNGAHEVGCALERWADDREVRLTHDERLMTRYRIKTRATVIEIQRSVGQDRCMARDVFDPGMGEFLVFHPTLAKLPRFSRRLGWFTWFPHFVHPLGSMVELVPHLWFAWRDEVLNEMRHRRSQDYTMSCQRFMRENFMATVRVLGMVIQEWEAVGEPADELRHYTAVYLVRDTIANLKATFEANPACAPHVIVPRHPTYGDCRGEYRYRIRGAPGDLEGYVPYFGAEADLAGERTIGMFSLYDRVLLLHCCCKPAFDIGSLLLAEGFKGRLEFDYEDTLDMGGSMAGVDPTFAVRPLPIPSSLKVGRWTQCQSDPVELLRESAERIGKDLASLLQDHHNQTFVGFLDEPHFFLDERTPREANRSEEGRQKLIELMKVALYEIDVRNRQFDVALNIDAILRELELSELLNE